MEPTATELSKGQSDTDLHPEAARDACDNSSENQKKKSDKNLLQERAIGALNSQQKVVSFPKDESSRQTCYVSCIAAKKNCSELEKVCAILCLSKEKIADVRELWTSVRSQQGRVYECLPGYIKHRFVSEPAYNEIQNSAYENCGLVSSSPGLLDSAEIESSIRAWIVIVDNSLLNDDSSKFLLLSLQNCHSPCAVKVVKSSVHAIYVHNPFSVTFCEAPESLVGGGAICPETTDINIQEVPRQFLQRDGKVYGHGHRLSESETGGKDLLQPAREFKLFRMDNKELDRGVSGFVRETLRFACGCLNSRTNGTIHFGIADGDHKKAAVFGNFSRKIVGVPIKDQDKFESELSKSIATEFGENGLFANNCIRLPVFVPVQNDEDVRLYVIEVDIEPKRVYTEDKLFKVNLHGNKPGRAYYRKGPNTVEVDDDFLLALHKLDEDRKLQETTTGACKIQTSVCQPNLTSKLQKLLCTSEEDVYRVVILSKPPPNYDNSCANFLSTTKWDIVIDFDNEYRIRNQVYRNKKTQDRIYCAEDLEDEQVRKSALVQQTWILANGSSKDGKPAFDYTNWFESERNKCLSNFVEIVSSHFPTRRTTVMFLLFSTSFQCELYLFQEFRKQYKGLNQLVYIAENKDIAYPLESRLAEEIEIERLLSSGLVGLPWVEFNEQIKQLTGQSVNSTFLLPTANDVGMPSDRNDFDPDILYPLSLNECDYIADLNITEQKEMSRQEELAFYSGNTVSWENFWFTEIGSNHVLKREVLQEAIGKTDALLQKDIEEGRVFCLEIKHEVGAGVTTLSKNVLWHFASTFKCRCCVVKQITKRTSASLLQLWHHTVSEGSEHLPVLALLDGFSQDIVESLESYVTKDIQTLTATTKPVIVFIKTKMYLTLPQKDDYVEHKTVLLKQKLSWKEQNWFQIKLVDMQERFRCIPAFNPEHLIAFMVMKHNFCPQYIRSVVEKSYALVNTREQNLLKYLSLISVYGYGPVFEAAFDDLMSFNRTRRSFSWTHDVEQSTKVLLKKHKMKNDFGEGPGICIVHRIIAMEIMQRVGQYISRVVLDFMGEVVEQIKPSYFTSHHLLETVKQMMLNRQNEKGEAGLFSQLILNIQQTDIEQAVNVLESGFKFFKEAVFMQQLARLMILSSTATQDESLTRAKDYAKEAVKMEPKKSHFLDTVGRIYKKEFSIFSDEVSSHWTTEDISHCMDLASQAIKWFRTAQECAVIGDKDSVSLYGEFRMMTELLVFLDKALVEEDKQTLRRFFISPQMEMCPESFQEYEQVLGCFRERFHFCIRSINEEKSMYITREIETESSKYLSKIYREGLQIYHRSFCPDIDPDIITSMSEFDQNRYMIDKHIFGDYFRTVFNLGRIAQNYDDGDVCAILACVLEKLRRNLKLKPYDESTLFAVTTVSMALHSPYGPTKMNREDSGKEYIDIYNVLCRWERMQGGKNFPSIYPLLFKVMFLWPREDNPIKPKETDYEEARCSLQACWKARLRSSVSDLPGLHPKYDKKKTSRSASILFYLGRGVGLNVFVHVNDIPRASDGQVDLKSRKTKSRLRRIEGRRETISTIFVQNPNKPSAQPLVVHYVNGERLPFARETLTFFLGFSCKGPIARDVQQRDHMVNSPIRNLGSASGVSSDWKYAADKKEFRRTTRQLREIETLEKKPHLEKNQETKVARKEELLKRKAELLKKQGGDRDPFE